MAVVRSGWRGQEAGLWDGTGGSDLSWGFIFFPGGLVWQWWDFHVCWDDHREEACEGCAAEPCTCLGFPCPPQGDQGSQSLGFGGKHLLSWGWAKPPPWLKGCPLHLQKSGWDMPHTQCLTLLPWPDPLSSPFRVRGLLIFLYCWAQLQWVAAWDWRSSGGEGGLPLSRGLV